MNQSTHNPFAPPAAEVADVALAGPQLASRGIRLVSAILDGLLQFGVAWLLSRVLPWNLFDTDPSFGTLALNGVLGLVVFLVLNGYLLVTRGQTIAKVLLGLRIVRPDGSRASPLRLLGLRYAVGLVVIIIPFVGLLYALLDCLLIFRASRKCLHDNIADTIVVKA